MTRTRAALRWLCAVEHWTALVALAFAVALVVQLAGVGLGLTSIAMSPSGTVEALYRASQEADYDAALALLDAAGRAEARAMGAEAWRDFVDGLSLGRTITEMQFGSQRLYGRNAVVGMLMHHADGSLQPRTEELVREGRHWRVMWPPGARRFVETVQKYDPWFGR